LPALSWVFNRSERRNGAIEEDNLYRRVLSNPNIRSGSEVDTLKPLGLRLANGEISYWSVLGASLPVSQIKPLISSNWFAPSGTAIPPLSGSTGSKAWIRFCQTPRAGLTLDVLLPNSTARPPIALSARLCARSS
jgi:hypothetical protein